MSRLAVVLFNLGGPDRPESVQPFLYNLFNDKAIIRLPQPFRALLARFISTRRDPEAREIYAKLGGGSPLLANTEAQADALAEWLGAQEAADEVRCFIAMRYWHPLTEETADAVKAWQPDRIVLLPLYPQYSTTTSASSLKRWWKMARRIGLDVPTTTLCCYPAMNGFVAAVADGVRDALRRIGDHGTPRLLFSAHGLPQQTIARGDPYQVQVERTASEIVEALAGESFEPVVCYQSRVGPLEWIRPYLEDELRRAAEDGMPVVIAPIAFVSEHSETLVELDIEYREMAEELGIRAYERVSTVGVEPAFVAGLGSLVQQALAANVPLLSDGGGRFCPGEFRGCAFAAFR